MTTSAIAGLGGGRLPDFSAIREKLFNKADANGDKAISFDEFEAAGKKLPVGRSGDAKTVFKQIDADGDGSLNKGELDAFGEKVSSQFRGALLQLQSTLGGAGFGGGQGPDIDALFARADDDGDGAVSRAEFGKGAKDSPIAKLLAGDSDKLFDAIDGDGDGSLSKQELTSFGDSLKDRLSGGASRSDALQAQNAYGRTDGAKDLTETLLKLLDGGKDRKQSHDKQGYDDRA